MSGKGSRLHDRREYVLIFCVLSCLTCENLFQSVNVHSSTQFNLQAELSDNLLSMKRQKSQSVSTQQFLSFKCDHCKSEFETSLAFHNSRTHNAAKGAPSSSPCSLEENRIELIHTERNDHATGHLRQVRSSKLGVQFIY
jgi:hypothetical protein